MSQKKRERTIMPQIAKSLKFLDEYKLPTKEETTTKLRNAKIKKITINSRKPGSSVDHKKPLYQFPKIIITSSAPSTSNNYTPNVEPFSLYKFNTKIIKTNKLIHKETDVEENYENIKNNNINIMDLNNINIQHKGNNENKLLASKKFVNHKINVDINKYKDISINFLMNNGDFVKMFDKMYKNDINSKKNWIEKFLFGKEVFKIRLETYIKNKMDIPSFIKNEIQKILNNQYYDYIFSDTYKGILEKFDEHCKEIENIYK